MNLCVLGFFKYFNFFTASTIALARATGLHLGDVTIHVILPIGVSFFTFQSLSYTIDVFRRDIEATRSWRDYLMFSSFFPQLVAGPIVRPRYFLPQMASARTLTSLEVKHYLWLFLLGYVKKTAIADNISPFVDQVFRDPVHFSQLASVTATWLYAVQIFCDFSGYSDMAIAVAGLLGYKLVLNFDAPYLSASIQDFWRRWHISLSSWIRDYIYLSLGGRRPVRLLTYRNLLITMLAGGLWHGASWTFVVWGGLHGFALIVNREFRHRFPNLAMPTSVQKGLGWLLTINFVCVCWILFRAPDFGIAALLIKRYFFFDSGGPQSLPMWLTALPLGLLIIEWLGRRKAVFSRLCSLRSVRFAFCYGVAWAVAISMLPLGYRPFIYFQF
jgi:alginate O-acetyltransferase complex protein AlgI